MGQKEANSCALCVRLSAQLEPSMILLGLEPSGKKANRQSKKHHRHIIHMFAGADSSPWERMESATTVVIAVDSLLGMNIMEPMVAGWIDKLIESGKVMLWTASPPCRTVSMCRFEWDAVFGSLLRLMLHLMSTDQSKGC